MPLCPSARPETKNSAVFGVVGGTVDEPRVNYLKQPQPVTEDLLSVASPVTPTEVFRIAGECAGNGCQHFDGQNCGLATRVANQLSVATETLPPCPIRRDCRWWQQEGKSACMRCPQVITDNYNPSLLDRQVATPT
ncbi:nitrogen fixation protein [Hyella patelloides]